jgi:hypothetical protein
MKNTFDIFNSLDLDLELFYAIRFNKVGLFLQGHYNTNLVSKYKKEDYKFTIDESGYVYGEKIIENVIIKIILT